MEYPPSSYHCKQQTMNSLFHLLLVLLGCASATVVVECLYQACFRRYRNVDFLTWCAVVNVTSNIILNTTLFSIQPLPRGLLSNSVLTGETIVVVFEYLLFLMVEHKNKIRLFILTFFANVITYSIGFLL